MKVRPIKKITKRKPIVFLDIDGVIRVGWTNQKMYPWGRHEPLDKKCCNVLNSIYDEIPFNIVISSDWRKHFTVGQFNEMFEHFGIKAKVIGVTPHSEKYDSANGSHSDDEFCELTECGRAEEINEWLGNNEDITVWVAVDDINMTDGLEHFVVCTRPTSQGIKQSGIKEKIIKTLKEQING